MGIIASKLKNTQQTGLKQKQTELKNYFFNEDNKIINMFVYDGFVLEITNKKIGSAEALNKVFDIGYEFTKEDYELAIKNKKHVIKEYTIDVSFLATRTLNNQLYINMYNTKKIELEQDKQGYKQGETKLWFTLLQNIYGDNWKKWDDFLAYQFNNIENFRLGECLTGLSNCGKTLYFTVKSKIFGDGNCSKIFGIDRDFIFNSGFANKRQTLLDDCDLKNQALINNLKAIITSDSIEFEKKGQERQNIPFFSNIAITSENIPTLLLQEMKEKRILFRKCENILPTGFGDELLKEIQAIRHHYKHHRAKNIKPNIKELFDIFSQYKELSAGSVDDSVKEILKNHIEDLKQKIDTKELTNTKNELYIPLKKQELNTLENELMEQLGLSELDKTNPFYSFESLKQWCYKQQNISFGASFTNNKNNKRFRNCLKISDSF
jgi:hypothetical protein